MSEWDFTHIVCLLSILISFFIPILTKSRLCQKLLFDLGWWWAGVEFRIGGR